MASTTEQLLLLRRAVEQLRARQIGLSPNPAIYAATGETIFYGCKVVADTGMEIALTGSAEGDEDHHNPDGNDEPSYPFEYRNIASLKAAAFYSQGMTATVDDAPSAELARYDIAYIYVGPGGPGMEIATGTPSEDVKADFDANGLNVSTYDPATDPPLPTGALPVARIYVEGDAEIISDERIADLRSFYGKYDRLDEAAQYLESVVGILLMEGMRVVDWEFNASLGEYPADPDTGDVYFVADPGTIDGIDLAEGALLLWTGDDWYVAPSFTDYLDPSKNLSDLQSAEDARENLGLGDASLRNTGTGPDRVPTNADLASPPPIGSVNPNTGAFTSLTADNFDGIKDLMANYNGQFDIWQEGSGPFAHNRHFADGWRLEGGATRSVTRESLSIADSESIEGSPTYYARIATTTAGSSFNWNLVRIIEDVASFAGQQVTLSFVAWVESGTKVLYLYSSQVFGSGGSAGVNTNLTPSGITLTTEKKVFSVTFTVPSVVGKTIGAGNYLSIRLAEVSNYSTYVLNITNFRMELGGVVTRFQRRSVALDLLMAQRYYQKSYNQDIAPGAVSNPGSCGQRYVSGIDMWSLGLPVVMRSAPSVTLYSHATGAAGKIRNLTTAADVDASVSFVGEAMFTPQLSSSQSSGQALRFHWVADARL